MRLKAVVGGDVEQVRFDCPGCGHPHVLPVTGPKAWGFNGSFEKPTFTPSILVRWIDWDDGHEPRNIRHVTCHSFVTDGRIQFLGDCTHKLAGQTVDMTEIEAT
jgi:hypothetical protein